VRNKTKQATNEVNNVVKSVINSIVKPINKYNPYVTEQKVNKVNLSFEALKKKLSLAITRAMTPEEFLKEYPEFQ
jgi:hypothetical protein